jgi:hypothetical protein
LNKALKTCDTAEQELPKVHAAGLALPGDFNESASVIFGGAQAGIYAGDRSWTKDLKTEGLNTESIGKQIEEARIKFGIGVAILGSQEQWHAWTTDRLKVLKKISAGLEVTGIQPPTELTKASYEVQSGKVGQKLGHLKPLGKLICKTWHTEACDEWDLPKDKYPSGKPHRASAGQDYEFWVEDRVLKECFVGLKMDAEILELSEGITILDEVHETMTSFFTWLPNELWMDRKPKEVRWLKKGLPGDDEAEEAEEGGEQAEGQEFDDE